jgi:hypothetical protein
MKVCCQCGTLAEPDRAYTTVLWAPASEHKNGEGYPGVRSGRGHDTVEVRIPRCDACRNRANLGVPRRYRHDGRWRSRFAAVVALDDHVRHRVCHLHLNCARRQPL